MQNDCFTTLAPRNLLSYLAVFVHCCQRQFSLKDYDITEVTVN